MTFRSIGHQAIDVALAALRRGRAIVLSHGDSAYAFLPMELATATSLKAFDPAGEAGLLVTPERLTVLGRDLEGIEGDTVLVRLAPTNALRAAQIISNPLLDGTVALPPMPLEAPEVPRIASAAMGLAKMAELLPAILVRRALPGEGPVVQVDMVLSYSPPKKLQLGASAALPVDVDEGAHIQTFRGSASAERHIALIIGEPDALEGAPLVRLHSECLTGDVLGSRRCDCGPQLQLAKEMMRDEGGGILLYLRQEGRMIGLANKLRAYALQGRGHDTIDANFHIGFGADERDYEMAAAMLMVMGITRVRLLTGNPYKKEALEAEGIRVVECIALPTVPNPHNERYLGTKRDRRGHQL